MRPAAAEPESDTAEVEALLAAHRLVELAEHRHKA